jgi:hypothetical protein
MMDETKLSYMSWVYQIKDFKGGLLGAFVILATLVGCLFGAAIGADFFPSGTYPRIVLALPGLAVGGVIFVLTSALLWPVRRASLAAVAKSRQDS